MNLIQMFYNKPYFENLKETKPFLEYLKREEQELRKTISGGKVLDIGCGNGRSTAILSDVSDQVIGIDFSERLLDQARKRLMGRKNVRVYLEDAKLMHFDDEEFDYVVLLWNTFGNLYSVRDRLLQEVIRVIKPEGKIILSIFSKNVLPVYLNMLKQNKLVVKYQDENYIFLREGLVSERFSREKIEKILKNATLTGNIKTLTDIAYWCEAQKPFVTY